MPPLPTLTPPLSPMCGFVPGADHSTVSSNRWSKRNEFFLKGRVFFSPAGPVTHSLLNGLPPPPWLPALWCGEVPSLILSFSFRIDTQTTAIQMVMASIHQIWTYEGRHVSNPRFQNLRAEYLSGRAISLSEDAVAILDRTSPKCIRVCDVSTGRPLADGKASEIVHECEVVRGGGGGSPSLVV